MLTRSLTRTFSIAFITLCAQNSFAEGLTVQEADALTKEDIASTQVLSAVCPTLIGNHPKFNTKVDGLTQSLLKTLSKATSLEQLQQDAEYQTLLKEAQANAQEVDHEEQKTVCSEVLNLAD